MRSLKVRTVLYVAILLLIAEICHAQVVLTGISNGQTFCISDPAVTFTAANPGTKFFYGPGVTSVIGGTGTFDPSVAGVGSHDIEYDNPSRITITVTVSAFPATTLAPLADVCVDEAVFALAGGAPAGGTYTGTGVDGSGNFDPAVAGPGTHAISYTNVAGTCAATAVENITVHSLPTITLAAFPDQCVDGTALILNQASPVGGTYSGTGVAAGSFYPAVSGTGTFPITYSYNDGNCSNTGVGNITVNAIPTVSFAGLAPNHCEIDPADALTGTPTDANGVFSGTGVFDNGNGTGSFDPGVSGIGNFTITYSYTDANSCVSSASQNVQVGTIVTLGGLNAQYCIDETNVLIVCAPGGGTYTAVAGLIDNGDGTADFDPSTAGLGTHTIEYTFNDGICDNTISQDVDVVALPTPAIAGFSASYCINDAPATLTGNYAPNGTFTGSGITDNGDGTATFDPTSLAVGGPYSVTYTFTNAAGCVASTTSQTNINALPTATVSGNASICEGDNTPITVNLTGALNYDFTYTTGAITTSVVAHGAAVYNTNVTPTVNTTYTVTTVTDGNGCTNAGAGSAIIAVDPQVAITTQPTDRNVCPGSNTSISVIASGVNLTYQWQKDGVPIAGAVNPIYAMNNVDATFEADYECVISSTCGGPLTSNASTFTLLTSTSVTTHPTDQYLCTGDNLNLEVVATGSSLSYQWKKDNVDLPGETLSTLIIPAVTTAESGTYTCEVTGACGVIESDPAVVDIDAPIVITTQPSGLQSCPGDNISINLAATGTNLSYQWQKNNIDIVGETSQSLVINGVAGTDAGNYRCVISSPCGASLNSSVAILTVLTTTSINTEPSNTTECITSNANFIVTANGSSLTYQWYKNGVVMADVGSISGSSTNTLVITGLILSDASNYYCEVNGTCGTVNSNPATLTVDDAISITLQPVNQTACEGNNINFTLNATGSNLSYQWQKNGIAIAGATNPTLTINSITLADDDNYRCVVSNSCGASLNSNLVNLSVNPNTIITTQPTDAVECVGNNINLTVAATGSNLGYQWYKNLVPLADVGDISGALTNNLSIANLDVTDAASYYCEVSGDCGSQNSDPAIISVDDAIIITTQPTDVQACDGDNISFNVTASGSNLSYQWQKSGIDIAGQTSPVLSLNTINAGDAASYRCVITNSCGSSLNSQSADLSLYPNTAITLQPADITECPGGNANFTIVASGNNLLYQWKKDGANLNDAGNLSGSLTNTLNISGILAGDNGVYTCEVTGSCGTLNSDPANLILNQSTGITTHPATQNACEGGNAVFNVAATGTDITYQWQKGGVNIPGETSNGYIINNVTTAEAGVFRCIVTGNCGSKNSNGALLTIDEDIVITTQPINDEVCETETSGFSIVVTGTSPTYQWRLNGADLIDDATISGATTPNLSINPTSTSYNGAYSCVVSGTCSNETSTTVALVVNEEVVISIQPQNKTACPADNVLFNVTATGTAPSYQWQKNGVNIPGETNSALLLNNVTAVDAGLYRCIITGTCGSETSNAASLVVNEDVTITTDPVNEVACEGDIAGFTIAATGTGLTYQWKLAGINVNDGATIAGATTNNITISPVALANAGAYVCEVSGTCGTENSLPASLTINEEIVINTQPQSLSACPGDDIVLSVVAIGSNLTYQWQKDGVALPGETNSGLLLNSLLAGDAGIYRCEITGDCGILFSTGATLAVNSDVSITVQPTNEEVCEGTSAGFVLTATGTGLVYQWKQNGTDLADVGSFNGTNTASLSVDPVSLADAGVYTCEVYGTCGIVNSTPANMIVDEGISISSHPSSLTACPGQNANFSIVASGANLSYQWQKDGVNIPGETSTGLSVTGVTAIDQAVYRCVISGDCGTLISNGALLTIDESVVIGTQPAANPVLCEGNNLSLTVVSTGTSLSYQWQKDGVDIMDGATISGALTDNLHISNVDDLNDGIYNCVVSGTCGTENSSLSDVVINLTTSVLTHPVPYTIVDGGDASFSVLAEGDNLTYQWQKNGINLTNGVVVSGATTSTLNLTGVTEIDEGAYRCITTGTCNIANSNPANLVVNPNSDILSQPLSITRCEGESAAFSVVASGTGNTYQWRKDGVDLTDNANVSGSTTANLNISTVSTGDAGAYTSLVNAEVSAPAILTVNENALITTHPISITRCEGDLAIFSVIASGSSLSYQWQKNGINLVDVGTISGTNTSVLTISSTALTDADNYRCVVTSACATAYSNPANLVVNSNTLITSQPTGNTICAGSSHTFSIEASGTNLSYSWKKDGIALFDGGNISGTSTANLTISSASELNAGSYTCEVTGDCGNENSIIAQLVVQEITALTLQPISATACNGDNASFSILAEGEGLSYQWQKNGGNIIDGGSLSGSTTSNLTISGTIPSDEGSYVCIVTGTCGIENTDPAILISNETTIITTQPTGEVICEGQTSTLTVIASGSNLTYQWKKGGLNLSDGSNINGSTTANLNIANATLANNGTYSCEITGSCGTLTSNLANIEVREITQLNQQPVDVVGCDGDNISFAITAQGHTNTYQWQKDGVNIVDAGTFTGSSTNLLSISGILPADDGSYRCVVSGFCNSINSNPATLNSYLTTSITTQPTGSTVCEGSSVTLSVVGTGDSLSYQWSKDAVSLTNGTNISGVNTANLAITNASLANAGTYTVEVAGICGTENSNLAIVEVDSSTQIVIQPNNVQGCEGDNIVFSVKAVGMNLGYQWQYNGVNIGNGGSISGATSAVLNINGIVPANDGSYRCIVTGDCGTVNSNPAILNSYSNTIITKQPVSDTLCAGGQVTLSLTSTGSNLDYQWKKNGLNITDNADISGSSTSTLLINNSTINNNGIYTCFVSGSCGSENSSPASVHISNETLIVTHPQNQTTCEGDVAVFTVNATGEELSYLWQKEGTPLSDGGNIFGSTSAVLTINNLTATDGGVYRCVVTGNCGTVNSDAANLEVNVYPSAAGVIIGTPSVCQGDSNVIFEVAAISNSDSYSWNLPVGATITSGAGSRLIEVAFSSNELGGNITVQGLNSCGTGTLSAVHNVIANPIPGALAGPDQNICVNTSTLAAAHPGTANGTWTVLDGPATVQDVNLNTSAITNLRAGSNTLIWTVAQSGCSSNDTIIINNNKVAAEAGTDLTICTQSVTLEGNTPLVGSTGGWSVTTGAASFSDGGNANSLANSFSTGINVLRWTITNGSCSDFDTVVIDNQAPTTSFAGIDQSLCSRESMMGANNPTVGTGNWSVISGSAIFENTTSYNSAVTNLTKGSNILRWTISNGICTSIDEVTLNNNQVIVNAGTDQVLCDKTTDLAADEPIAGIGNWSVIQGSAAFVNNNLYNTRVTGLAKGTNTLAWNINNNGCISADTLIITNDSPTDADAGIDQSIMADFTTLQANIPIVGTGAWSLIAGSSTIANPLLYNTNVTGLALGDNTFRWTISNNSCISFDEVIITNFTPTNTNAGPDQTICSNSALMAANEPEFGFGEWSVIQGSASFQDNSQYNTLVTGLAPGDNILRWTIWQNGYSSDDVVISNDSPTTASAGGNQTLCAASTTLSANNPIVGEGIWTVVSGAGLFNADSVYNTSVTEMAKGENIFRWTITNKSCSSSDIVTVVNDIPTMPEAGEDQTLCTNSTSLNPNTPSVGIGSWSVIGGSANFAGNEVSNLADGLNTFRWTITNNSCSLYDEILVTNNQPSVAQAGADKVICSNSVSLAANNPINGTGIWSIQSGSASINDINSSTSTVTNLSQGINVFRWTISNNGCTDFSEVIVNNSLITATTGTNQDICSETTVLEANNPVSGSGQWSVLGGSGSAIFDDATQPDTRVSALDRGANILRWTIVNNICISYADVVITNNLPTVSYAGPDEALCADNTTLQAGEPIIGTGEWSVLSGSATIGNPNSATSSITNLSYGVNTLRWTISNNGCTSTNEVVITNNSTVKSTAGVDVSLCADSTVLFANNPPFGLGQWAVVSGSATFVDNINYNTKVTNLGRGDNTLRWLITNGACSSADDVTITNNSPSRSIAGGDQTVCGNSTSLYANVPSIGKGQWILVSGSGTFTDNADNNTSVTGLNPGENTLRWTIENNGCFSTDDVVVFNDLPYSADAGQDMEVCTSSASLFANDPVSGIGQWSIISGSGTIDNPTSFEANVSNLGFGNNTLRWTITYDECITTDDIIITNNQIELYAGIDQVVGESSTLLAANNPSAGDGSWSVIGGSGSFSEGNNPITIVNNISSGLNTYRWTLDINGCLSTDDVSITYNVPPDANFIITSDAGCPPHEVIFVNNSLDGLPFSWDFDDGTSSSEVSVKHVYNSSGIYNPTLTIIGNAGEIIIKDTVITIYNQPEASFLIVNREVYIPEEEAIFINTSVDAESYQWEFGDGSTSTEKDPKHTYSIPDSYDITLNVWSEYGCYGSTTQEASIEVFESGTITFPNAFTPNLGGPSNGAYNPNDFSNDVFFPIGEGLSEYHLEIFNKWGIMVFESYDIYYGWDGYYNGKLLDEGVYVWKVSGKYNNGRDYKKVGTVLLIQ